MFRFGCVVWHGMLLVYFVIARAVIFRRTNLPRGIGDRSPALHHALRAGRAAQVSSGLCPPRNDGVIYFTSNTAVTGLGAPNFCPRFPGEHPPTSRRNSPGSR